MTDVTHWTVTYSKLSTETPKKHVRALFKSPQ